MFQTEISEFLLKTKKVAVAVSGGGDSMALVHMLETFAKENHPDLEIHALTVDHGLRVESMREAASVAEMLKDWPHTTHHILEWLHDEKPSSSVMALARQARYSLMADYCSEHGIESLFTGHHRNDQVETFLMRVIRGSGLSGCKGMEMISERDDLGGLTIVRPLLNLLHKDLIAYCEAHSLEWFEDPSNENPEYERVRMRQLLRALEDEKEDASQGLALTCSRLQRASSAIDQIVEAYVRRSCEEAAEKIVLTGFCAQPEEIQVRVLERFLGREAMKNAVVPPKLNQVEQLVSDLAGAKSFLRKTLAGCLIEYKPQQDCVQISRENV